MITPRKAFLTGAAFSIGQPRRLEDLLEAGLLSQETYEECRERDLATICVDSRPLAEGCAASVSKTLERSGLSADRVDRVVVVLSTPMRPGLPDEYDRLELHNIGMRDRVTRLDVYDCTAFAAGIQVACEHIEDPGVHNVLLLLVGHTPVGMPRHNAKLGTVFGDGVASCIITKYRQGYELAAVRRRGNPLAEGDHTETDYGEVLFRNFARLRSLVRLTLARANTDSSLITAIFGTHGGQIHFQLMAEAAGSHEETVYAAAMQRYGHIYSCDNIIAFADFLEHYPVTDERLFCFIGWGPRGAGAVILRELSVAREHTLAEVTAALMAAEGLA